MKICKNCSTDNPADANWCRKCGNKIEVSTPAESETIFAYTIIIAAIVGAIIGVILFIDDGFWDIIFGTIGGILTFGMIGGFIGSFLEKIIKR